MLELQRLATERVGQEDVAVIEHGQGQVGGVALLGMRDDVCRARTDAGHLQDRLDRHAFPGGVELRPARDAVDVRLDGLARQVPELAPGQREWRIHLAPDLEVPVGEVGVRHGPVVEDREFVGLVLARRDALGDGRIRFASTEETLEHADLV